MNKTLTYAVSAGAIFLLTQGCSKELVKKRPFPYIREGKTVSETGFLNDRFYEHFIDGNRYSSIEMDELAFRSYKKALTIKPDAHYVSFLAARQLIKMDRGDEAAEYLEVCVREDPDNISYKESLFYILSGNRQTHEKAAVLGMDMLDEMSADGRFLFTLSKILEGTNRKKKALEVLIKYVETDSYNPAIAEYLARRLKNEKNYKKALSIFLDLYRDYPSNSVYALEAGVLFEVTGNKDSAVSLYREVIENGDENEEEARKHSARIYLKKGDWKEALNHYERLSEIERNSEDTVLEYRPTLGEMYYEDEQYYKALTIFDECLLVEPENERVLFYKSLVYFEKGDLEKAAGGLRRVLSVNEEHYDALYNLGLILIRQKKYNEAMEVFSDASDIGKEKSGPLYMKGIIYRKTGNFKAALAKFNSALALDPGSQNIRYQLSRELFRSGKIVEASRMLDTILNREPGNLTALKFYSRMLSFADTLPKKQSELEEKITTEKEKRISAYKKRYRKILIEDPENFEALYDLGGIMERSGNFDSAVVLFRKIIEKDSLNEKALNYLGDMFADRDTLLEESGEYLRI
ncbi:MAG: tetratricopeptide repeat protein, partial [Fibrobacterota bacterium]